MKITVLTLILVFLVSCTKFQKSSVIGTWQLFNVDDVQQSIIEIWEFKDDKLYIMQFPKNQPYLINTLYVLDYKYKIKLTRKNVIIIYHYIGDESKWSVLELKHDKMILFLQSDDPIRVFLYKEFLRY